MNMISHLKHVQKCLNADMNLICIQNDEEENHIRHIFISIFISVVVKLIEEKKSSMIDQSVQIITADDIYNDMIVALMLMLNTSAV